MNEQFLDKTNYRDVWIRNVLVGFLAFLRNRVNWVNEFTDNPIKVNVPFYGSLSGTSRFSLDSFKDDISVGRLEMPTDPIPRGSVYIDSWAVKPEEFTNPNIWINQQQELNDELIEIAVMCKKVPMKLTAKIEIIVDSEIDVMKGWQSLMQALYMYKYYTYDYLRLPINTVFNMPTDMTNPVIREKKLGNEASSIFSIPMDVELHTIFPIMDYPNEIPANKQVQWILQTWTKNQPLDQIPPNITPGGLALF